VFFWDMTGAPLDPRTVLGRLWPLFRASVFFLAWGPPPWRGPAMSAAAASQLRAALSHLGAQQAHQSGDDDHVAVAAAATTTTKSHLRVLRGGVSSGSLGGSLGGLSSSSAASGCSLPEPPGRGVRFWEPGRAPPAPALGPKKLFFEVPRVDLGGRAISLYISITKG